MPIRNVYNDDSFALQYIGGNLIPNANNVYTLGNSSFQFNTAYLADNLNVTSTSNQLVLGGKATISCLPGTAASTTNIPAVDDTVVCLNTPDTLTNKTLTAPTSTNANIYSATLFSPVLQNASFISGCSGVIQSTSQPLFDVGLSSSVTGVTGSGTKYNIVFNTVNNLYGSGTFDTTTGGYTIPVAGYYHFYAYVQFSGVTTSNTDVQILINADNSYYYAFIEVGAIFGASGLLSLNGGMMRQCSVNDVIYISVQVSGNTTNNVGINAGSGQTRFWGYLMVPS